MEKVLLKSTGPGHHLWNEWQMKWGKKMNVNEEDLKIRSYNVQQSLNKYTKTSKIIIKGGERKYFGAETLVQVTVTRTYKEKQDQKIWEMKREKSHI